MPLSTKLFFATSALGVAMHSTKSETLPLFVQFLMAIGLVIGFGVASLIAWREYRAWRNPPSPGDPQ